MIAAILGWCKFTRAMKMAQGGVEDRWWPPGTHCVVTDNGTQVEAKNIEVRIAQSFFPTPEFIAVSKVIVHEYYQLSVLKLLGRARFCH